MPTFAANLQKTFSLILEDGVPQATIENDNGIRWLRCCPLCGCTHQILGVNESLLYTPLCQTRPLLFKAQQISWHKLHPDVVPFATLHLMVSKGK